MTQEEKEAAAQLLMSEMGLHLKKTAPTTTEVELSDEETYLYMKRFQALDADGKGFITINDLRTHFKVLLLTRFFVQYSCFVKLNNCSCAPVFKFFSASPE